jgi:hypothetical protein
MNKMGRTYYDSYNDINYDQYGIPLYSDDAEKHSRLRKRRGYDEW